MLNLIEVSKENIIELVGKLIEDKAASITVTESRYLPNRTRYTADKPYKDVVFRSEEDDDGVINSVVINDATAHRTTDRYSVCKNLKMVADDDVEVYVSSYTDGDYALNSVVKHRFRGYKFLGVFIYPGRFAVSECRDVLYPKFRIELGRPHMPKLRYDIDHLEYSSIVQFYANVVEKNRAQKQTNEQLMQDKANAAMVHNLLAKYKIN